MGKTKTAVEKAEKDLKIIQEFIDLLDRAEKQNCELIDLMKEMDDEQQDVLHELELKNFCSTEGHRKACRIQLIRQVRRMAKDMIGLYLPIKEFAKENKKIKTSLQQVISKVKNVIHEQSTRVYTPRKDTDSSIAGKHFEAPAIDISAHMAEISEKREQRKK